jgi:voltage-gated potassium channel Kch
MPNVPRSNLVERQLSRFMSEPVSVRNALRVIVAATFVIVAVSGVAIRLVDPDEYATVWEGMWWALQSVTTVGYGDVTPTSGAGKLVGAVVILEGVAFLAIVTAAITSDFVARAQANLTADEAAREDLAAEHLDARLDDITSRLERLEQMLRTLRGERRD